ncbi:phospholipid carrier-dependent glycosyltransferase [Mangrovactinospora gilvigrisea]|uniref:Polyprenol-phosphate-mannose--protein mannosyltransferase n=1 Tax=Mangrovactinospora gilvigrisea TaxID=1428644 RepID=A0A1J7CE79_9ACTN|nr:phospholipid carrier-dependent glycosyltransferase [Mangrovactinospora gilvigrisea]
MTDQPDGPAGAHAASAGGPPPAPSAWQRALARFGYRRPARPDQPLRELLVPPFPGEPGGPEPRLPSSGFGLTPVQQMRLVRAASWLGPLLVAVFAGVLRLIHLGQPNAVIFDETYYPKDAWSLLHHGFETAWPKDADKLLVGHPPSAPLGNEAAYVAHPPLGKWVMALGEAVFGMHPFGWRFMTALLGTLAVLLVCRIGRRLFRSTFLGCVAGLLLALDGLAFVMSRTALLDGVLMFWVLAAFGCLLVDRDRSRARLADAVGDEPDDARASTVRLGWRPWRIAAGLCLGAACATKWNGMFFLVAFAVMAVLWDSGARRLAGSSRPYRAALLRDALPAFLSTAVLAFAVYVVSWSGWIFTSGGYYRQWGAQHPASSGWGWVPDWVRSLWYYQYSVYQFNANLHTPHNYQSNPWSWLVVGRPVSFYYEQVGQGTSGCTAHQCAQEVLAIGTPALWWVSIPALIYVLWRWVFRRDWRAGALLCAVAAGYLPWFHYQARTIFYFYAVAFVPFLCLAVAMALGALIGPARASDTRRAWGTAIAGVVVAAVALNFIYFYPILTGGTLPMDAWRARMWLPTWI